LVDGGRDEALFLCDSENLPDFVCVEVGEAKLFELALAVEVVDAG
jgi:hypothetical protein